MPTHITEIYLLPVWLSLFISLSWFICKLNIFRFIPRVNDKNGILLPSAFSITSPFLFTYVFSYFNQQFIEVFRLILPVVTFILGQSFARLKKEREDKDRIEKAAKALIIFIGDEVVSNLSNIEQKLVQFAFGNIGFDEVENYCKEIAIKLDDHYQRLSSRDEFFGIDVGIVSILYVKKVRNYLTSLHLKGNTSSSFNLFILDLYDLKLEGYSYASTLIKDFLIADKLFAPAWIALLKDERRRIRKLIQKKEFQSGQLSELKEFLASDSLQQSLEQVEELIKTLQA